MRRLWQRIFACTLLLVIVSQLAVLFLHRYSVSREEARRFIAEYTSSLSLSVEDGSAAAADAVLRVFNRNRNRAWMEDASGKVIAGAAPPEVRSGKVVQEVPGSGLLIREGGDGQYIASIPVTLREGPAKLSLLFLPPRGPGIGTLFLQGLIFVSVIGLLLALWIARRVSKPLRALRDEVLEIAGGNLESRVMVKGHDEIADVAKAVNHLADNLARHIRGMRELLANISHEMRSPLARVQVSLAMLEEEVPEGPKTANRLALINEELEHLNKLIGTTLLTSKLDLQAPSRPGGPVAFSDLCAEACRRHAPLFLKKGLDFTREIQNGIAFPGDETLLATLVSNLLDNAAQYTETGGSVSLRLSADGGNAVLAVENSHAPLPDELRSHIFEPFYRGGIATGDGAGLGLSLVRKIAQMHGGDVTADNAGGGVRFTVRLSLAV